MKRVLCVIPMALLILAVGCSPSEKKQDVPPLPKAPAAEASATAPATPRQPESAKDIVEGYSRGLKTSLDRAKLAQTRTDLGAIKDAVRNYQVDNGKFPASLEDIKSYLRGGVDLSLFAYDPATGAVSLK